MGSLWDTGKQDFLKNISEISMILWAIVGYKLYLFVDISMLYLYNCGLCVYERLKAKFTFSIYLLTYIIIKNLM